MDKLVEGTLVRYHGEVRNLRGDLAFIRESEIRNDDRRWYLLDTICYVGGDLPWDDDQPITTFGDIWATRDDFTVVDLPDIPKPLQPGNYVLGYQLWRRSSDGSWDAWEYSDEGRWKLRGEVDDLLMDTAIYLGPLP